MQLCPGNLKFVGRKLTFIDSYREKVKYNNFTVFLILICDYNIENMLVNSLPVNFIFHLQYFLKFLIKCETSDKCFVYRAVDI